MPWRHGWPIGELRDDALLVLGETEHRDGMWDVHLRHRGGDEWWVRIGGRIGVVARPVSCRREPALPVELAVTEW